jgi:Zn ribbon nucleic-acid-binding protein
MICPACQSEELVADFETPRLEVRRCASCGHRLARHELLRTLQDYHEQYDQGAFVDALRATRVRQAKRILGWIREADPSATRLLDYGCGRGWFLEEAKAAGWQVTGADSSEMAIRMLRERGIAAAGLDQPIASEVVTLLDVIEHLARTLRDAPVLIICVARPGLLDSRPAWGGGNPRALAMSKGAATLPWLSGATPSITDQTSACTRLTLASFISRTTCWPLSMRTNLISTPGTCAWKARMSGRTI